MSDPRPPRYLKPMNKLMIAVQKLGIPTGPAMVLTVPGRKSGQPRSTPMTPFEFEGGLYVVAGYPGADWAANARAAGTGTLSRGRRSRQVRIVELTAAQARPILRAFPVEVPVGVSVREEFRDGGRRNPRRVRSAGRPHRGVPVRPDHRCVIKAAAAHSFPRRRR